MKKSNSNSGGRVIDVMSRVIEVTSHDPRPALRAMAVRLTALNSLGVQPAATAGLAAMFEEAAKSDAAPMMQFGDKEMPVADVMRMARDHNPAAIWALNSIRMENVDTYVRATLDLASMFETVDLQNTDQAMIEQTYRNPVNVRFAGEDGGTRVVKAVKARTITTINMREIHSDTFAYPMRDINLGTNVGAAGQGTVDIAWDVQHKINMELLNFLNGGTINGIGYGGGLYGPFKFTGTPLSRTMMLHSSIQTANLPTTNLITWASLNSVYGKTTNLFDFYVLQAIIDYVEGFRGVFSDGDMEATGLIYLPSSEVTGLFKQINPTGQFYNKVGEQVLNSFTKVEYGGRVWTLVGTPILPKGACYPVLNKKVGNLYFKRGMDFEHTDSNPLKNVEERTAVKVCNYVTLEPWRVHGLKVIYSQAANAGTISQN